MLIEVRPLTKLEFNQLLEDAPDTETRNLKKICSNIDINSFDFFEQKAIDVEGLVINKRPIYFGAIIKSNNFNIWTFVNSNVREQFTLYKVAKITSHRWAKKYGEIFATMEKVNPKNIKWTKKIGFKMMKETDKLITFKLGGR